VELTAERPVSPSSPRSAKGLGRVAIIVPAYNEAMSIGNVLDDLHSQNPGNWDIIVVNDNSKDNTLQVALRQPNIVIDLPINLGIGGCVQSGLLHAYRHEYSIAVQFDSDGQHVANEIKTLLWGMKETNADVVIGSRFISSFSGQFKSSYARRIGINLISITAKLLTGKRIKDPTSGFRAFNSDAIKLFAENYPIHFPEPESIILLHKNNFKIHEISTLMNPRNSGESSIEKKAAFYMISVLLGMIISAMRPQIKYRHTNEV
jgi:glycosyltransferase involved in cell wall biosynthesis